MKSAERLTRGFLTIHAYSRHVRQTRWRNAVDRLVDRLVDMVARVGSGTIMHPDSFVDFVTYLLTYSFTYFLVYFLTYLLL